MGLAGSKNSSSLLVILLCVSETCVRLYKRPRHVAYLVYIAWSDTVGRHISGSLEPQPGTKYSFLLPVPS